MQIFLVYLHNMLRWIILILLLISIAKSYAGWQNKFSFQQSDRKIWLITLITAHITLLIGLYQVLLGRYGILITSMPAGTRLMKDKFYRFFWVEHPTTMILSIVLITLGYGMYKKPVADEIKYKKAFWFFMIALLLILVGIPWPFRGIIGRPILPGV